MNQPIKFQLPNTHHSEVGDYINPCKIFAPARQATHSDGIPSSARQVPTLKMAKFESYKQNSHSGTFQSYLVLSQVESPIPSSLENESPNKTLALVQQKSFIEIGGLLIDDV